MRKLCWGLMAVCMFASSVQATDLIGSYYVYLKFDDGQKKAMLWVFDEETVELVTPDAHKEKVEYRLNGNSFTFSRSGKTYEGLLEKAKGWDFTGSVNGGEFFAIRVYPDGAMSEGDWGGYRETRGILLGPTAVLPTTWGQTKSLFQE